METIQINFRQLIRKAMALLVYTMITFTSFATYTQAQDQENWILSTSVKKVDFYYKIVECKGQTNVLLKFENKNDFEVNVLWKEIFTTQTEEGKEGAMGQKELTLSKGITMPVDCFDLTRRKNIVYANEVDAAYVAEIKKFAFKIIAVNRL